MGTWFWLTVPLALVFVGCWAGIPLWFTLTRWDAELDARHAEIAAAAVAVPAAAAPVTREAGHPADAVTVGRPGR